MGMIWGSGKLPKEEQPVSCGYKIKTFLAVHWKGLLIIVMPIILCPMLFPAPVKPYRWTAYCLLLMGMFWMTECIPLAITSFLPIIIFPLTGVMNAQATSACYMNDTIMMFIGSLFLAYSVEQSGLHKRMAYFTIRVIGYSHLKLLLAMSIVTTFVSMWITNTAATTMVIPINFALLKVFENEGLMVIYNTNVEGEKVASDITTCYFCAATYSATIGGIGTLVGTGTNLVFKGLFSTAYPAAPEYLSFPKYSAFAVPVMIVLEIAHYMCQAIFYLGLFRKNSKTAKSAVITEAGMAAAKKTIEIETKKLGNIKFWEYMVVLLFGSAMLLFFCRSPQIFYGWGDFIADHFHVKSDKAFVKDSALAMAISFLMLLCPATLDFCKTFQAKRGGFALSKAAKDSGLNEQIGIYLKSLKNIPNVVIILLVIVIVIFVTNFASNVAVANVFCPIAMQLAQEIDKNPLWYLLASGIAASFAFMLPVGTPGNLIVQGSANVPTSYMMLAGVGPTFCTIIILWVFLLLWAPVIWPDVKTLPQWSKKSKP